MADQQIRVALLGCGGIARGHIAAYRAMGEQYRLAYCVDVDEAKARALAAQADCRAAYQGDDEHRIVWLEPGAHSAAQPGTMSCPASSGAPATAD